MSDTTQDHGYEKPKVERYGDFRELTRELTDKEGDVQSRS